MPTRSIWDGVYRQQQAADGSVTFEQHCARCHTEEQLLIGDAFMLHWEGHNLGRLFRKIKETMPADDPGSVTDAQKLDVVAFLLEQNGFPSGATDLPRDEEVLATIDILSKRGTYAPRSGAFVEVFGCLQKGATGWQLNKATDPVVATVESTAADSRKAPVTTGNHSFLLLDPYPDPTPLNEQTLSVKGLLIKDAAGDRINVVSLEKVSDKCLP